MDPSSTRAIAARTVTTAGGLDVEVRHGGHGIKVVVLPSGDAARDDALVAELAGRAEVYALGRVLDGPAHDVALAHEDVLAALGLTNVPVIGLGVGALAAAELAANAPRRVAKLVLVDPPAPGELLRRTYRITAPTRVVRSGGADGDAAVDELVTSIGSCDVARVDLADASSVADAIDGHLRGRAPGANDGLLIRHVDDLEWHEVRVMLVDGKRSVVKNRFVDFGEHRTICHTWYDPGIALARHSHFAEELIYVLQGGFWIDDVWCPEGTVIVLEPGTYFGPLVAGPEGAYLLEAFPGIGVRAGQDRTGWEERAKALKVEPLPDPPFAPPVTTGAPPA